MTFYSSENILLFFQNGQDVTDVGPTTNIGYIAPSGAESLWKQ
jgi:hypothetical protein